MTEIGVSVHYSHLSEHTELWQTSVSAADVRLAGCFLQDTEVSQCLCWWKVNVKSLQNPSFLQNGDFKQDHCLAGSNFFFASLVVLAIANESEQTSNTNTVWSHLLLFREFPQLKSSQYETM